MRKIRTTEVFTPTTPAHLAFVERQGLNDQLVDALRTPGKQIVVYGPSGSGKTTLLVNKLKQLYSSHITSRCTGTTTFDDLLLGAFDALGTYYSSSASAKRSRSISLALEKEFLTIKAKIEAARSSEATMNITRLVAPQLTGQRLAEFCGAAECCWVLEDFHKVPEREKANISQLMKVFMDTAAELPNVKIVAIGAVDSARDVVQHDPEMRNRVAEVAVPLMSESEIAEIVAKGEELLNIRFGSRKSEIASYSSGLPAVCHQLCLNICFASGINETCSEPVSIRASELRAALERYLADASDTLKTVFDRAMRQQRVRRFDNTRLILQALTRLGSDGAGHAELLKVIREREPHYPTGNLTTYLRELQAAERGEVLRFDPTSGKYFFSDPLYMAYSQCLFTPPKQTSSITIRIMGQKFIISKALEDGIRESLSTDARPDSEV